MKGIDFDHASDLSIPKRLVALERRLEELERMTPSGLFPTGGTTLSAPGDVSVAAGFEHKLAGHPLSMARTIAPYFMIPALRGLWWAGCSDENGNLYDLSGQGRTLSATNTPTHNFLKGVPVIDYSGANPHHARADEAGLDILGTESYIASTRRGLTLGGWFMFDDAGPPTNEEMLVGKRTNASGNHSYWLRRENASGQIAFHVSSNGTANTAVNSGTDIPERDTWYFIAGILDAYNDEQKLRLNDAVYITTNSGAIYNGAGPFLIGSYEGAAGHLDGKFNVGFVGCAHTNDDTMRAIYELTRGLYTG